MRAAALRALAALALLGLADGSAADDAARGAVARAFAEQFLAGRHEETLPLLAPVMRDAFGAEQAEQVRASLLAKLGEAPRVGAAWREDVVEGFHRFRVPVAWPDETLDFRVVVDARSQVAGFFVVPHVAPPAADAAGPGREVEVSVGGGGGLPGTLTLPDGDGPFPGAVLVHGSGPQDRDESIGPNRPFRDLAWGLAARGIAVLRYDKRTLARVESLAALGDGLTLKEEAVDDAAAAAALLAARPEVDAARVFLLGHSLGAAAVTRAASAPGARVAGLIALAGNATPLPETVLRQTRYLARLDGEVSAEEQAHLDGLADGVAALRRALDGVDPPPGEPILGAPFDYYRDLEAHDAPAEAAALGIPVLVLQGRRDYQVTMEDFARWRDALADRPSACSRAYDDLDHLFRAGSGPSGPQDYYERAAPVDARVVADVARWILEGRCPL